MRTLPANKDETCSKKLQNLLREKEAETLCIEETKFSEDMQIKVGEKKSCSIWRKRKEKK